MDISPRDFRAERAFSDRSAAGIRIRVRRAAAAAERERWRADAERARVAQRLEAKRRARASLRAGLARLFTPWRSRSAPC